MSPAAVGWLAHDIDTQSDASLDGMFRSVAHPDGGLITAEEVFLSGLNADRDRAARLHAGGDLVGRGRQIRLGSLARDGGRPSATYPA